MGSSAFLSVDKFNVNPWPNRRKPVWRSRDWYTYSSARDGAMDLCGRSPVTDSGPGLMLIDRGPTVIYPSHP